MPQWIKGTTNLALNCFDRLLSDSGHVELLRIESHQGSHHGYYMYILPKVKKCSGDKID